MARTFRKQRRGTGCAIAVVLSGCVFLCFPAEFAHAREPGNPTTESGNGSLVTVEYVQPVDESQPDEPELDPLAELEQLLQTPVIAPALAQEVTTVTGTKSSVGRSAAAVFVITSEMIRRSGVTSIPEALRMAPGLDVARVNSSTWSIGSRGFNGENFGVLNNKLLVLMDGRTIYSPVTGGVYWDVQDTLLNDIERIEVIRGPGATIWGANAVNGVINIITKRAADTQGELVKGGGGTFDFRGQVAGRHGGQIGDNCFYRVYAQWTDRGPTDASVPPGNTLVPNANFDQWQQGRVGFRSDWTPNCEDTFTFQGDYYQGQNGAIESQPSNPAIIPVVGGRYATEAPIVGGNVLGRWTRKFSDDNQFSVQAYYDRADRNDPSTLNIVALIQKVETFDVDFRHNFQLGCRNNIVWGAGYRVVHDNLTPLLVDPRPGFGPVRQIVPPTLTYNLFTCFAQDQIMLMEDRLYFTIGAKLLHYDLAPFEVQPTARLLWTPDHKQAVWAAFSRPVRTPTRLDQGYQQRIANNDPARFVYNPNLQSENLMAYEIGYRAQPVPWFSWDLALFYNDYRNLQSFEQTTNPANFNGNRGQGYGVEIFGKVDMTDNWRISAWYSFLALDIQVAPNSITDRSKNGLQIPGSSPRNQAFLMSSWDVTCNFEVDLIARYVDRLHVDPSISPRELPLDVPSYITMDLRAAYRVSDKLELSVVGQNLLAQEHLEFYVLKQPINQIPRGVYGMLTWTW